MQNICAPPPCPLESLWLSDHVALSRSLNRSACPKVTALMLTLALLALIARRLRERRWSTGIVMLGVAATALFYGDAIITPAISVLSAVEGLSTVSDTFTAMILPISIVILIGLFAIQSYGTAKV